MKKFFSTKIPFIILLIAFAVFNILFFVIAGSTHALQGQCAGLWISFVFLELSFVAVGCVALFVNLKSKSAMTALIPLLYVCGGYLGISVLANAILMAVSRRHWQAPVIVNVLLIGLAAALFVVAYRAFSRVRDNTEHQKAKVQELRQTAIKVNSLVYLAKDEDVKKAIRQLKEDLDYSSPMSGPECAEYEQQLAEMIDTLKVMLTSNGEKESILAAVEEAEGLLRVRNQTLMAARR